MAKSRYHVSIKGAHKKKKFNGGCNPKWRHTRNLVERRNMR